MGRPPKSESAKGLACPHSPGSRAVLRHPVEPRSAARYPCLASDRQGIRYDIGRECAGTVRSLDQDVGGCRSLRAAVHADQDRPTCASRSRGGLPVCSTAGGDTGAFNQLIVRWARPIFAIAYRTLGREGGRARRIRRRTCGRSAASGASRVRRGSHRGSTASRAACAGNGSGRSEPSGSVRRPTTCRRNRRAPLRPEPPGPRWPLEATFGSMRSVGLKVLNNKLSEYVRRDRARDRPRPRRGGNRAATR